jgi:hypothetical protein
MSRTMRCNNGQRWPFMRDSAYSRTHREQLQMHRTEVGAPRSRWRMTIQGGVTAWISGILSLLIVPMRCMSGSLPVSAQE